MADRFDLRNDIELETSVTAARYDEEADRWLVMTDRGKYDARFLILAVGNLSSPRRPDFPGLASFQGEWYMTARWPEEPVDLDGKRIGVVGTGSTGIQVVIESARRARALWVFQRTPNYSMPAHNGPLDPAFQREVKRAFAERRRMCELSEAGVPFPAPEHRAYEVSDEERRRMYEEGWAGAASTRCPTPSPTSTATRPRTRRAPSSRGSGSARSCATPAWRPSSRPRTTSGRGGRASTPATTRFSTRRTSTWWTSRRSPIERITPRGIRTADAEYELDVIVFALGFDAMTGGFLDIDIRGRAGLELREKWAAGPRTYLGLTVAGFPNLFLVTGPGSPGVLSNMVVSIEQHVDWLADCIAHLRAEGLDVVEATPDAEEAWVAHVNEIAAATLYPQATSWYVGANVPGKPRVFMPYVGGCGRYRAECDEIAVDDYRGFRLSRVPHPTRPREQEVGHAVEGLRRPAREGHRPAPRRVVGHAALPDPGGRRCRRGLPDRGQRQV